MKFLFIDGIVGVNTFKGKCKENGLDPSKVVFIFPGNRFHHIGGTTLFSIKGGGGLAEASAEIGGEDYPTLSLPTTHMESWSSDKNQQNTVEGAIKDLWRAVGAGYSLMLPVRKPIMEGKYFSEWTAQKGIEPNFWGGYAPNQNLSLADHYITNLDKLIGFMRLTDQEKQEFIQKNPLDLMYIAYTEGQQMSSNDDPWLQPLKSTKRDQPGRLKGMKVDAKAVSARSSDGSETHIIPTGSPARVTWTQKEKTDQRVSSEKPKIIFKIPPSYAALYGSGGKTKAHMAGARALLNDYTKSNSAFLRFFTGHWNRHHIEEVNQIVKDIDEGNIPDRIALLTSLDNIKLVNPSGSLAKRISYIKERIGPVSDKDFTLTP